MPRWSAVAVLMVAATHVAMTLSPTVNALAKSRGATSRRAIEATAWLLDFDRDGLAPAWLTAGWDSAPFDGARPDALLGTMRPLVAARPPSAPGATSPPAAQAADSQPHLLFVTMDALRADEARGDLGPTGLGARRSPTPTLDSLARAAATFVAYTPSAGTEDTFASLFADAELPGLLRGVPSGRWLPQRLARAGYRLGAFVEYAGFPASGWGWPHIERRPHGGTDLAFDVVDFIASAETPAFVWIHWMPLHAEVLSPFSPQAYSEESQRLRYANGLAVADQRLAEMMSRLRAAGLAQRTLVVLSADHGEELGEHGHYHHNLSLYEPAVRVPLWFTGPGVRPARSGSVVSLRDLHPTLLDAGGGDHAATERSLWPVLVDSLGLPPRPSALYSFLPQRGASRRYGRIHPAWGKAALIDPVAGRKVMLDLGAERVEAYDLAADPLERINLAGRDVPWVAPMRAALDSALRVNALPPTPPRSESDSTAAGSP